MFFYVSLVLVIVAAVTLVIGLLSSGLPLVIVSIASSALAGVFLILTVVRERPRAELAGASGGSEEAGAPRATTAVTAHAVVDDEEFPIADYDELRVSEILPLLSELDPDELEVVRAREESGKARASVLGRLDELLGTAPAPARSGAGRSAAAAKPAASKAAPARKPAPPKAAPSKPPAARATASRATAAKTAASRTAASRTGAGLPVSGYDELSAGDVAKALATLDASELKKLRTYEKRTKARKTVLDRIEAELAKR